MDREKTEVFNEGSGYEGLKESALLESIRNPIKLSRKERKLWKKIAASFPSKRVDFQSLDNAVKKNSLLINSDADEFRSWLAFSTALLESSMFPEAEESIKKALSLEPKKAEVWNFLGMFYSQTQRYDDALRAYETALSFAESLIMYEIWNNIGIVYKRTQQYDKAETAYKKALSSQEDDFEILGNLANLYFLTQRYSEAESTYQKSLSLNPSHLTSLQNYGAFLLDRNRLPAAQEVLEKVLELHDLSVSAVILLSSIYLRIGSPEKAKKLFYDLSRSEPNNPQVWYHYGLILYDSGLLENGELALKEAIKLNPSNLEVLILLGAVYFEQTKFSFVDELLQKSEIQKFDPSEFLLRIAEHFSIRGKSELAIQMYRKIISVDPSAIIAWNNLGIALGATGQFEEAIQAFQEVLKLNPEDLDTMGNLANIYLLLKQFDKAESLLKESLAILGELEEPLPSTEAKVWLRMADLFFERNQLNDSEKVFIKAHQLDPTLITPLNRLANLLIQSCRYSDAEIYAKKALQLTPSDEQAWMNYGLIHCFTQRFAEAEKAYRKVLEINDSSSQGWYNLADVLIPMNRIREAESALKRALELDPNYLLAWVSYTALLKRMNNLSAVEMNTNLLLRRFESDPKHLLELADHFLKFFLDEQAIQIFKYSIQKFPKFTQAYLGAGIAYGRLQLFNEAIDILRRAQQLDSENSEIRNLIGEMRVRSTLNSKKWLNLMKKPLGSKNPLQGVKDRYESLLKDFWPPDKPSSPPLEYMAAVRFFFRSHNFMLLQFIPEHIAKRGKKYMVEYYTRPGAPPVPKIGVINYEGKEYRINGTTVDNLSKVMGAFQLLHEYPEALKAITAVLADSDYPPLYEDYLIKALCEIMLNNPSALATIKKINNFFPNHEKSKILGLSSFNH